MENSKPKPALRISIATADETVKVRLYPAGEFGGPDGLYRLKIGRTWAQTDQKYVFFTAGAALEFAARYAGLEQEPLPCPSLSRQSRVRVAVPDGDGGAVVEKCFAHSPPFQGMDGRWRIFVLTSRGVRDYLCDEVTSV